jgi:hypothetical protein
MTSAAVTRLAPGPARTPAPAGQPAIPPVPAGAAAWARARAARAVLHRAAGRLPVRVQAPDGSVSGAGGPGAPGAVSDLGFGPCFQRMWELYLAYSEAGFRAGYLDVHQLLLERCAA